MEPLKCIRIFADPVQISECRKKIKEKNAAFARLSSVLALAGNEVRLKMLYLMEEEGELCPCDIADILEMTVPAISQHLRKLKDKGIIKSRKSGNTIYYSLEKKDLNVLKPFFKYVNRLPEKESKA